MKTIQTLTTIEGRNLITEIFKELRYEKQSSSFSALATLWRLCTSETELFKYSTFQYTVRHPLGFFSGTALWLEEIVNRFYFTTINSFVYFGAAILLTLIGIRRFSDSISDNMVIAGVIFEAMLLVFMFVVMLYTPNEEIKHNNADNKDEHKNDELLLEIGEISRDFAAALIKIEDQNENIKSLLEQQSEIIQSIKELSSFTKDAVSPNPELLNAMRTTAGSLNDFNESLKELKKTVKLIRKEEVEFSVKKEVEKLLLANISNGYENQKA
ncbi:MAG: hypothetical protein GX121_08740 [Ignavibacteria bacterium]|nr:hypothetical protein [Ignavibacteria bacterium]